jgi:catechol 2,3-dioxygenase-like lactoylglutathione lyase family enzyme
MPIKAGLRKLGSQLTTYRTRQITFWRMVSGQARCKKIPMVRSIFAFRTRRETPIAFDHRLPPKVGYGPASKQLGLHLIHGGFVVKDLATENRLYVELLSFRLYWQGGFKDDGTDWYELQVPDGPEWIENMLNVPTSADHHELGVQNHFSFGVQDVHAAAAELRARGLQTFDRAGDRPRRQRQSGCLRPRWHTRRDHGVHSRAQTMLPSLHSGPSEAVINSVGWLGAIQDAGMTASLTRSRKGAALPPAMYAFVVLHPLNPSVGFPQGLKPRSLFRIQRHG